MKLQNIFKKGSLVFGSAVSGRQISIIRDNIEKISYLINYDLLATYQGIQVDKQKKIDRFFNVNRPHEVVELYLKWIEEYCVKTKENPFQLDDNHKITGINSPEFIKSIFLNIVNYNLR